MQAIPPREHIERLSELPGHRTTPMGRPARQRIPVREVPNPHTQTNCNLASASESRAPATHISYDPTRRLQAIVPAKPLVPSTSS